MLNGQLTLHNITDVEAFTAHLIPTPPDEDLHAYLIATTWELSITYRKGTASFSTYATTMLRRRLIDYHRKHHGDTRYHTGRNKPQLIPLHTYHQQLSEEQVA